MSVAFVMTTISDLLGEARAKLAGPEVAHEAEWLLEAICGIRRTRQFSHPDVEVNSLDAGRFRQSLQRRIEGEPLAYIIGYRDFWNMRLAVTPDVLIPQPDTEILVEQALARIPASVVWNIADLGTGSGAIALALAIERPSCPVLATDVSGRALEVAATNAATYRLHNVSFAQIEWLAAVAPDSFEMIVSNPPYIADNDTCLVTGDVCREPRIALAAGSEGLDDLERIIENSCVCLKHGGWLLLEHGYQQAEAVTAWLTMAGYTEVFTARDYAGHERVSGGRRPLANF
jgi:release factor glutamine methyltransferase